MRAAAWSTRTSAARGCCPKTRGSSTASGVIASRRTAGRLATLATRYWRNGSRRGLPRAAASTHRTSTAIFAAGLAWEPTCTRSTAAWRNGCAPAAWRRGASPGRPGPRGWRRLPDLAPCWACARRCPRASTSAWTRRRCWPSSATRSQGPCAAPPAPRRCGPRCCSSGTTTLRCAAGCASAATPTRRGRRPSSSARLRGPARRSWSWAAAPACPACGSRARTSCGTPSAGAGTARWCG
mmetsp:Transcript_20269/g.53174  ORF Transcript_20269/g.53174 Transcript_20269/m.53174 type:complete len:239 (+) Transcript_20269:201-917(+)